MTVQLHALVEVWPSETMVYIVELPGCLAAGSSAGAALERLPDEVEAHLGWLAVNGFPQQSEEVSIEIAEQLAAHDGRGPLFDSDRAAVSPAQLDFALRVGALARRDLIDVYRATSGLRRTRRPEPNAWSLAEHLLHVARLDLHYLATLTGEKAEALAATLPYEPVAALQAGGALAAQRLLALSEAQRGAVTTAPNGEGWTAGKVVRRMTAHLREHYPWVLELARG